MVEDVAWAPESANPFVADAAGIEVCSSKSLRLDIFQSSHRSAAMMLTVFINWPCREVFLAFSCCSQMGAAPG